MEGTGAYGAALARLLRAGGVAVMEVDRPDRRSRRRCGKSTRWMPTQRPAALATTRAAVPKTRDGAVEAIRVLRVARSSAVKARTQTTNQLNALLLTGPADLREKLRHLTTRGLIDTCARLRPTGPLADPEQATKVALRRLGHRYQHLSEEILAAAELKALVISTAPRLLTLGGVGVEVAGQLLTTAGDNPHRLHSPGRFRPPVRRRPDPGQQRKDPPSPAQPWRRPGRQQRPVHRRAQPAALRPAHQPIRGTADQRRTEQT